MFDYVPIQEQIKGKVTLAMQKLDTIRAQEKLILAELAFLRDVCTHSEKGKGSACGEVYTYCKTCGKQW